MTEIYNALLAVITTANACREANAADENTMGDLMWVAKRLLTKFQEKVLEEVSGTNNPVDPFDLTTEEKNHALAGKKIQAIKLYRSRTGKGLRESKEKVDAYMAVAKPGQYWDHYTQTWVYSAY